MLGGGGTDAEEELGQGEVAVGWGDARGEEEEERCGWWK
jgi:hypothetical protein